MQMRGRRAQAVAEPVAHFNLLWCQHHSSGLVLRLVQFALAVLVESEVCGYASHTAAPKAGASLCAT